MSSALAEWNILLFTDDCRIARDVMNEAGLADVYAINPSEVSAAVVSGFVRRMFYSDLDNNSRDDDGNVGYLIIGAPPRRHSLRSSRRRIHPASGVLSGRTPTWAGAPNRQRQFFPCRYPHAVQRSVGSRARVSRQMPVAMYPIPQNSPGCRTIRTDCNLIASFPTDPRSKPRAGWQSGHLQDVFAASGLGTTAVVWFTDRVRLCH